MSLNSIKTQLILPSSSTMPTLALYLPVLFFLQTGTLMSHVFFQRYTVRFGKTICVFPCDLLRVLVLTEPQTTQNALEPKFIPLARIPNSPSKATALKFPRHHSVLPKKH